MNQEIEIDMKNIINNYGTFDGSLSRAIDFGGTTPSLVVSNLLTCDGDVERQQRKNIFNEDLNFIGIAHGAHPNFEMFTVILTCTQFISNDPNDNVEIVWEDDINTNSNNNNNNYSENNNNYDDNLNLPPGVKSLVKSEKIIIENGKKIKVVKITKVMENGNTLVETEKEPID